MKPGQYFILKFDFSTVERSLDANDAAQYLQKSINQSFEAFYKTYSKCPSEDAKNLINPDSPTSSLEECVWWVNDAISKAQEKGDKALAGVQGVRMASFFCLVLLVLTTEYLSTDLPPC